MARPYSREITSPEPGRVGNRFRLLCQRYREDAGTTGTKMIPLETVEQLWTEAYIQPVEEAISGTGKLIGVRLLKSTAPDHR